MNKIKSIAKFGMLSIPFAAFGHSVEKPNVIVILVDDLGWNDLGCMGSEFYETPNIDRLAKQGVVFTNAYSACQVSSPSRASILTGKTPARHGITNWIGEKSGEEWRTMNRSSKLLPAQYEWSLSQNEMTLPKYLKNFGYTTFMAGKWHLGDVGSGPEDHGFDVNVGGWESGGPKGGYFSPYSNPKLQDGPDGENLSMRLSKETVSFIKNHKKNRKTKNTPFFAYLSFYAVHGPLQTTKEKWNYFRDKAEKMGINESAFVVDRTLPVRQTQDNPVYAGLVHQMDDAVGLLLDAIDELKLDENTMIIFTSDNGGVTSGDSYSSSLLPLRGGKGRQWEGGLRVPLIIQTPETKVNPLISNNPVIGMDFYPTILDYAKLPEIPTQHVDGISLLPCLAGDALKQRAIFWHYPHYGNQGGEPSTVIREGDWKLIFYHEDSRLELYNLAMDIGESEPLNAQYPDTVTDLFSKLTTWLRETNAKMPVPDMQYNPQSEKEVKNRYRTTLLFNQEKTRMMMFQKNWSPNADWWGSNVTVD